MKSPLTVKCNSEGNLQSQRAMKRGHFRQFRQALAGICRQLVSTALFISLATKLLACSSPGSTAHENDPSVGNYVSVGMTKAEAIHELQTHRVDYTYDAKTNSIEAMQRNVSRSFSIITSVAYSIQLNSEDRVSSVSKHDVYTGP